jgi:hypothetical protein
MYVGTSNFQHMVVKKARVHIDCDGKTGRVRITVSSPDMSRIVIEVIDLTELELS